MNIYFFFLLLLIPIIPAFATNTISTYLVEEGQAAATEVIVDNTSTIDLTANVVTVAETTETVGGVEVDLSQQVEFVSTTNDQVTLVNTQLSSVVVEIPHRTIVSAPATWDKILQPQIAIPTSGTVPSGFVTPTTSILVGSPDVILVFDKAVTLTLTGTTGQTAYKLAGSSTWILISTCGGTFANPSDPPANGECSVTDGTDTKILTFHFTEFSGLSTPASTPTPTPTPTPSTGSSGGSGNTGVGSPRIYGNSGGSSGGGTYNAPADSSSRVIPAWFDSVMDWYRMGDITPLEFLNAYDWIVRNILK